MSVAVVIMILHPDGAVIDGTYGSHSLMAVQLAYRMPNAPVSGNYDAESAADWLPIDQAGRADTSDGHVGNVSTVCEAGISAIARLA